MQKVYHSVKSAILNFLVEKPGVLNSITLLISLTVFLWVLLLPQKIHLAQESNDLVQNRTLRAYFQNIGQGDSTLFVAPNGNSLLLDAGPFGNSAREEVGKNISIFDNTIDIIVGTHPDSDHVGGFESVLGSYSTSLYVDPGFDSGTSIYKNLLERNSELGIKNLVARKGVQIVLDQNNGVTFETLFPDMNYVTEKYKNCMSENQSIKASKSKSKKIKSVGRKNKKQAKAPEIVPVKTRKKTKSKISNCRKELLIDTNEISIVGQLRYGSTSIMMTGDAPVSVEKYLISKLGEASKLKSQILKVGHHGSETSTAEDFLDAVEPDYAIFSVGKGNKYGHPNIKVRERLEDYMRNKFTTTSVSAVATKVATTTTNMTMTKNFSTSTYSSVGNIVETDTRILRTDTIGHSIEFTTKGKIFMRTK